MSNLKRGRTLGRNSSRRKALYQALAISLIENAWGITPQSGDSVLIDVIKMNDTNKAN